jgi:hypothetical protein
MQLYSVVQRGAKQDNDTDNVYFVFFFLPSGGDTAVTVEPAADNLSSTAQPQIDCLIRPTPQVMHHAYVAFPIKEVPEHPFVMKPAQGAFQSPTNTKHNWAFQTIIRKACELGMSVLTEGKTGMFPSPYVREPREKNYMGPSQNTIK